MKKLTFIAVPLGIIFFGFMILLAVFSPLRFIVPGFFAGESFHDGKPTSYWIHALSSENPQIRRQAVLAFQRIGPNAEEAVPALCDALEDDNTQVRWGAAHALGAIGKRPDLAVPALAKMLGNKSSADKVWAMVGLSLIGPEAKAAVPNLIEALDDWNPNVRGHAAGVLGRIGPEARAAIPKLIEKTSDKEPYDKKPYLNTVGEMASAAIWRIDPQGALNAGVPRVEIPWDRDTKE